MQACESLERTASWQEAGAKLKRVASVAPAVVAGRVEVSPPPVGWVAARVAMALVAWSALAWVFIAL